MKPILLIAIVLLFGLSVEAQKSHKTDANAFIQQDLERKRLEVEEWKARWGQEYDTRKSLEMQLERIRSAVAKAAKL